VRLTTRANYATGGGLFIWEALHAGRAQVLLACLALICLGMGLGKLAAALLGRAS